jgi:hypothetical protein
MYNFDSEISWLPKYSIRSHKEYYFLNSKNQTNLNLTTYIYIYVRLSTYMRLNTYIIKIEFMMNLITLM